MIDYARLHRLLYEGRAREVEQLVRDAVEAGRPVKEILDDGLIAGMRVVGEDFRNNIVYVPEVLTAARAMKAGLGIVKPLLQPHAGDAPALGSIVIGTVRGDLHDIGKNLVCMMAEGAGFEVHDIGVDQSAEKFLAAAGRFQPAIVGMSSLLTTTMAYMGTVIQRFKAEGLGHVKIVVGGAPVTSAFAAEIGADGYGEHASAAVDVFLTLVPRAPRP